MSRITEALSNCCVITVGSGSNLPSSPNSAFSFSRRVRAAFLLFSFIAETNFGSEISRKLWKKIIWKKSFLLIRWMNDKKYICCEYFKLIVRKVSIFLIMRIIFSLLHSCFFYCQGTQVLLYDKMILCGTKDTISFGIDIQSRICGVMYRNNW